MICHGRYRIREGINDPETCYSPVEVSRTAPHPAICSSSGHQRFYRCLSIAELIRQCGPDILVSEFHLGGSVRLWFSSFRSIGGIIMVSFPLVSGTRAGDLVDEVKLGFLAADRD